MSDRNYTIDKFFKENEVRVGEGKDFTVIPPLYYQSLDEAFYNYFNTFRHFKDSYHFLLNFDWDRQAIAFSFTNTDNVVFSILGFHRFFELLLKDLLRRIDPFLAVKFLENEEQVVQYLNDKLDHERVNTVEFREALNRFKEAKKYYVETKDERFEIVSKFSFLLLDDTLERLARWRNRIMHNGSTLPNIFVLDYLVTQRIVPLVLLVLEKDKDLLKDFKPRYLKTISNIDILAEIGKIKFDFNDFNDSKKKEQLAYDFLKLAHLKELGRATFNLDFLLVKGNRSFYEPYYDNPLQRYRQFAESESKHQSFYSFKECPCCQFGYMVSYRKEIIDLFTKKKDFITWVNCFLCTYSIKNNIEEPKHFGYAKEDIFFKFN